jgi:hypothetical protein
VTAPADRRCYIPSFSVIRRSALAIGSEVRSTCHGRAPYPASAAPTVSGVTGKISSHRLVGALARYDRPAPALTGYDQLLTRSTR